MNVLQTKAVEKMPCFDYLFNQGPYSDDEILSRLPRDIVNMYHNIIREQNEIKELKNAIENKEKDVTQLVSKMETVTISNNNAYDRKQKMKERLQKKLLDKYDI